MARKPEPTTFEGPTEPLPPVDPIDTPNTTAPIQHLSRAHLATANDHLRPGDRVLHGAGTWMWSAGDFGRPEKDHHHNSGSAVEGTSTTTYLGDSLSDLPGTPVRRTEAANATGMKRLDPALGGWSNGNYQPYSTTPQRGKTP